MSNRFLNQQGYLSFAINSSEVDYVRLAYVQAMSIKATQQVNNYAVVVRSIEDIEDRYRSVFDHVIELPHIDTSQGPFAFEKLVWQLTPFKETVKIESDILFTSNLDHWWRCYNDNDVVIANSVLTYWGDTAQNNTYRRLFVDNQLPNVYNAWTFFRYSKTSSQFFKIVSMIIDNWEWFRDSYLKNCRYPDPVTDEVYAIAAKIMGESTVTVPSSIPVFVHMKPYLQNLNPAYAWHEQVRCEFNNSELTLGFHKQWAPLHYQDKSFITEEILSHYESITIR